MKKLILMAMFMIVATSASAETSLVDDADMCYQEANLAGLIYELSEMSQGGPLMAAEMSVDLVNQFPDKPYMAFCLDYAINEADSSLEAHNFMWSECWD
jgi:hypothetical protein